MSFYGVTDLWTYVIGALGIILLPGPNSLFVLSVATARGVKAGYQGAMGVFVGDTVLLICTALGAASLLRSNPALFLVVKYAGAVYLAWVGLNLIWSALRTWRHPVSSTPISIRHRHLWAARGSTTTMRIRSRGGRRRKPNTSPSTAA